MPEINFKVKIIGGKRTPLEVWVRRNPDIKTIELKSGVVFNNEELESVIDYAIVNYIGGLPFDVPV